MVTFKLVAPLAALLVAWFAASAYCVSALATLQNDLVTLGAQRSGGHQPVRDAPPVPVSVV
jgi:hypothetical protein